ncbi:hypothetical protein NQ317_016540 [Molorchus minor]|uniref:BRISC and BRCA1-A complex member 2 n=1 Tax=Molorchus minor TaxID=1323400 RepID=A0ABQ9J7U0_9CUCU|nr:hypothetical protein NQ317_016540 [Molorchus minor]
MTDFVYNTDNILCNFPTCLRKNIEELCLHSQIGLSAVNLEDISILSNKYNSGELNNYHFIIKVPYAGKRLKWEQRRLRILNEFHSLYKKVQVEKLLQENIYSRYGEEYSMLVTDENGVKPENVEVSIDANSIQFLISLRVDCSSLPEFIQPVESDYSTWYNPGEDFAQLRLSILKLDGSRSNIQLQLSARLEQVLGNSKNLPLPDFKRDTILSEYVSLVMKVLETRVQIVADHFRIKKVYIMNLAAICNRCIVEYDTETYNRLSFLYNVNDYDCLVTVNIGTKFPQEKPSIQLSSIYCQEGKQCNEHLDRYPYDPNLRPDENIERLLEFLSEAVSRFKNHRH